MSKQDYCWGCHDDFYNGHNDLGVKRCWSLKDARVVKRWRIGTWTQPTQPGAFTEVKTLNCHHAPGSALYEKLPACAVDPVRLDGGRS